MRQFSGPPERRRDQPPDQPQEPATARTSGVNRAEELAGLIADGQVPERAGENRRFTPPKVKFGSERAPTPPIPEAKEFGGSPKLPRAPQVDGLSERIYGAKVPGYPPPHQKDYEDLGFRLGSTQSPQREIRISEEDRRMAADEFMSNWSTMVHRGFLDGLITTLAAETPEEKARLLAQFDFFTVEKEKAAKLATNILDVYTGTGGQDKRVVEVLREAQSPSWPGELRVEIVKEFALEAISDHLGDLAVEALAVVFAVPTGPVGAVFTVAFLLKRFE